MAISWRDVAIWMTAVITAVAAQGPGSVRASPTLESYASIDQGLSRVDERLRRLPASG